MTILLINEKIKEHIYRTKELINKHRIKMDCTPIFKKVLKASRTLNVIDEETINKVLLMVADEAAIENTIILLLRIKRILHLMDKSDPKYDRLLLISRTN